MSKLCNHEYDASNKECQEHTLVGKDGNPNGVSRCPHRWACIAENELKEMKK